MTDDYPPCTQCGGATQVGGVTFIITRNKKGDETSRKYLCWICNTQRGLDDYSKSGTLSTPLWLDAAMASRHFEREGSLRPDVLAFYQRHKDTLLKINAECDLLSAKERVVLLTTGAIRHHGRCYREDASDET